VALAIAKALRSTPAYRPVDGAGAARAAAMIAEVP
jgi:hypothetical protein